MKEAIIKINDNEYKVSNECVETYNQVIIYKLIGNTPSPIYSGSTLKDACVKWLNDTYDCPLVFQGYDEWMRENDKYPQSMFEFDTIDTPVHDYGKSFDEYVDSLDGEELFIMLIDSADYTYHDWRDEAVQ